MKGSSQKIIYIPLLLQSRHQSNNNLADPSHVCGWFTVALVHQSKAVDNNDLM